MVRRLAAIMFTDVVGYTADVEADEATALRALEAHRVTVRPIFAKFNGREVKTIGDAFLVEFESALDAVQCAVKIQDALHDQPGSAPGDRKIRLRIGIHVGDVVRSEGDVLGDTVNIAARIVALADPEGVCVTQQVYDQVRGKVPFEMVRMPPAVVKNIRLPVNIFRIVPAWEARREGRYAGRSLSGRQLAVLPLASISPDPNDAYFADGLTDELISALSQVRDLSVTARTSVTPYKTQPKPVPQVAAELGVEVILEGSVRKAKDRIRVALQLVDVGTQRPIWATTYDREIDNVFEVQADVARRTAEALRLELSRAERQRVQRQPTENLAAYDLYLQGLAAAHDSKADRFEEAVSCFERATQLDPMFADAYGVWANLLVAVAGTSVPMRTVIPRARELVARALEIDPNSSDAHAALGNIAFQFDNDWSRAEDEFRTALRINPSNTTAGRFYGAMLVALGRLDEAKEVIRETIRLDPGGGGRRMLAWAELLSGNTAAALEYAEGERDSDPASIQDHVYLGFYYLTAGRREDALREADTPIAHANETELFDHALLNALVGRPAAARKILRDIDTGRLHSYNSATDRALLYAALGESDRALDLLEQDLREGDPILWSYYQGIWFDSIRADPRFLALLRQYGLPLESRRPAPALLATTHLLLGGKAPPPERRVEHPRTGRARGRTRKGQARGPSSRAQ